MYRMTSNRRVLAHALVVLAGSVLGIIACSSDDKPPGLGSGSSASSTSSGSTGSTGSTTSSGALTDAGDEGGSSSTSSSSSSGTADAAPETPCVGDDPVKKDGGTLPSSCPGSATCSARCTKIAKNFRVGLAQTAIDCFTSLPSCDDTPKVFRCISTMLSVACTDPTATDFCKPLVTACDPNAGTGSGSVDIGGCASLVTALSADGRATFKTCMEDKIAAGTCPEQVGDCFAAVE